MKITPGTIESSGHVLLTGPVRGTVTLEDGTVVDVTAPIIEISDEQAEEIAHKIGLRYVEEGHPDDIEYDEDEKQMVQRPFEYEPPKKFAHDKPRRVAGTPRKSKKG